MGRLFSRVILNLLSYGVYKLGVKTKLKKEVLVV